MLPLHPSPGVLVRLLTPADAADVFTLADANREHLRPWLPWISVTHEQADTERFLAFAQMQAMEGSGYHCGIFAEGRYAGGIGLDQINGLMRSGAIGYWLGREYEGRGLMLASVRALLNHAFSELQLHRIEIRCALHNARSCAIPQRLGFTHEGVVRDAIWADGAFHTANLYSLLSTDESAQRL